MDLMGALTVIKQTIDITKSFREIDDKIDAATWKIRLSELVDKLIDTKDALIEAKERERELLGEIESLRTQLVSKKRFVDENGLLFEIDQNGAKVGEPFCNLCFVKEERFFRLRHFAASPGIKSHFKCDNCKLTISTGPALPLPKSNRRPWIE